MKKLPAKHLSSTRVQNSLRATGEFICILFLDCDPPLYHIANILLTIRPHSGHNFAFFFNFQIRHRVGAVSHRSTWRVHYKDTTRAENLIASKRRKVDDNLAKIEAVHFFFSAITGTRTNAKTAKKDLKMMSAETKQTKDVQTGKKPSSNPAEQAELDNVLRNFFPDISYFIAFTPSESCHPESLFQFLHFRNTEAEINYIKTRVKYESEEKENTERLPRKLFNVLKDYDNEAVQHFLKLSSQFCYTKEQSEMVYDCSDEEKEAVFGSRKLSPDNLDCRYYCPCLL